jgi:AraC family transcriptional regulator, regulatory protein of adaptative response / methylated-DNA-[protein]-cysteine methyltransferase
LFESKERDAQIEAACYLTIMKQIDTKLAWAAFSARNRAFDGMFVGAVKTTGIYCKPSCPARHPLQQNVEYFADGDGARAAGYRACLRCKPDEVGRDREAVANALRFIETAEEPPALDDLASAVGYAPHHFHRLFKRDTGVTPAAYARGLRAKRAETALNGSGSVTDAIYAAGYSGPSRFYAETKGRLGMTPSAWKNGGAGVTIRWAVAQTELGKMLLAATDKGICRLSFDEDESDLRQRFPTAINDPAHMPTLPLDIAGTAFQLAVWQQLMAIPPGETRSYAQIAAAVGKPGAVRATGSANGANNVAVLIPCHRVIRSDGSPGGYAYGLERKAKLLAAERNAS